MKLKQTPKSFISQAKRQLKSRHFDKAVELYQQALSVNPFDFEAQKGVLESYLKLGHAGSLKEQIRQVLLVDNTFPLATYYTATAHYLSREFSQAKKLLLQVVQDMPDQMAAYYYLAKVSQYEQDWQNAVRYYQVYLKGGSYDEDAHGNLALCYFHAGELEDATEELKRLFKKSVPVDLIFFECYVTCLFLQNNSDALQRELRRLSTKIVNNHSYRVMFSIVRSVLALISGNVSDVLADVDEFRPDVALSECWKGYYDLLRAVISRFSGDSYDNTYYFIGDEHGLAYARNYNLYWMPSLSATDLASSESNSYKEGLRQFFDSTELPEKVIFSVGERDCRLGGSIVDLFSGDKVAEEEEVFAYIEALVSGYVEYIEKLSEGKDVEISFYEVPMFNSAQLLIEESALDIFIDIRREFNRCLNVVCQKKSFRVVKTFDHTYACDKAQPGRYHLDAYHLQTEFLRYSLSGFDKQYEPALPQPSLHSLFAQIDSGDKNEKLDQEQQKYLAMLKKNPQDIDALRSLGRNFQLHGNFVEAEDCLRRSLALFPGDIGVYALLSEFVKYKDVSHPDIFALKSILQGYNEKSDDYARMFGLFALGRMLHQCGVYEEAFEVFEQAWQLKMSFNPEQAGELIAVTAKFLKWYRPHVNASLYAERSDWGNPTNKTVFVVGLQRSGTSLTEQILSAHSSVKGAGELPYCFSISRFLDQEASVPYGAVEAINYLSKQTVETISERYLSLLEKHYGQGNPEYIVDKMPLNFLYLGIIALLFPNAKIIHLRRHPLDNALSLFMQNFVEGHMNSYTHDLEHIAQFYRLYREMMDHWKKVLPLDILDVHYEKLVADTEGETKRMLSHIGLEFEPGCMEYYKNKDVVCTASNWQVRQPIYKTSVQKWKKYEKQFQPLKEALKDYVDEYDDFLKTI